MAIGNGSAISKAGSSPKKRISDDVIGGAFAGVVARLLTAPFDVIKIRFQLQTDDSRKYTSMRHAFKTVVKEEGFFSLWKGNLSATCLWISYAMVQFSMYGFFKNIAETIPDPFSTPFGVDHDHVHASAYSMPDGTQLSVDIDDVLTHRQQLPRKPHQSKLWRGFLLFLAGAGAGITSTVATYPFDIMRTQFTMQGQKIVYNSMNSYVQDTWRTKGISGFYAGVGPAVVGITPYMGLSFAFYETLKLMVDNAPLKSLSSSSREMPSQQPGVTDSSSNSNRNSNSNNSSKVKKNSALTVLKNGLCGGLSGGMAKFSVYPLDTVKKRLQAQVVKNTLTTHAPAFRYSGIVDCIQSIYVNEGIKGFYRGLVPTTVKAVVATAVTFAAYEGAKDFLAMRRLKDED